MFSLSSLSWIACRFSSLPNGAAPLSLANWVPSGTEQCIPAQVPGTILSALLLNGTFTQPNNASLPIHDPYVDDWLSNETIPDISWIGSDFYTFVFRATLLPMPDDCSQTPPPTASALALLSAPQLSYRASLYTDGVLTPTLDGNDEAVGMFKRHDWILGNASSLWCNTNGGGGGGVGHGFALIVRPPDHPGIPSAFCSKLPPSFNTSEPCGQGGNHSLAMDGVISQDLEGWDWIGASPDRNTGLIDGLELNILPSGILLRDGAVSLLTSSLHLGGDGSYGSPLKSGSIQFRASLFNVGNVPLSGSLYFSLDTHDENFINITIPVILPANSGWIEAQTTSVSLSTGTQLWWPHTLGLPTLYNVNATFIVANTTSSTETTSSLTTIRWRAGLRTVDCNVSKRLQGRVCSINGLPIFIEGGNFIGTDLLSRPAWRASDRYFAEVKLHVSMNFNTMRLWGGHGGHPSALFDAADSLGILLWNEFFMSGDNNGRWAGNASWPLDHTLYNNAVSDTIKRLRCHPSLLVHVGGNELFPFDQSPAPDILSAMVTNMLKFDPETPFVQSSMGSNETGNFSGFDPTLAFAPSDGPYGILDDRSFFTYPAPGKQPTFTVPWAFQPEIGASAHPSYISLTRFLSSASLNTSTMPGPHGTNVSMMWNWHNYESFNNNVGIDAIYSLLAAPTTFSSPLSTWSIIDYTAAAAIAQETQLKALFESYADRMWTPRSGVLYWKSASPWPAFRGALYDWYLASGGGFWGARHALELIHIQLSRRYTTTSVSASIAIVNRGPNIVNGPFSIAIKTYDFVTGNLISFQTVPTSSSSSSFATIESQSVVQVNDSTLIWPSKAPLNVSVLWRLELSSGTLLLSRSDYILSTLSNDPLDTQNLTALAMARTRPLTLEISTAVCGKSEGTYGGLEAKFNVSLASTTTTKGIGIGIRCELRDTAQAVIAETGAIDDRLLPLYASDGFFSLLKGEVKELKLSTPSQGGAWPTNTIHVECEGWNVPPVRVSCV